MIVDSSSEDDDDNDEVALMIKTLDKFMNKKSYEKIYGDDKKRLKKRPCQSGDLGHFIVDYPINGAKEKEDKQG